MCIRDRVNDDTFSKGLLGQGFAVIPEDGQYYAPFDGKVKMIFPTKHAIGLVSETGIEVLIHIEMCIRDRYEPANFVSSATAWK